MSEKKEKRKTVLIYLDGGQKITLTHDESVWEEVMEAIRQSMMTGAELCLDGSYDVDMEDEAGNYLMALNGKKIIGYNF